MYTQPCIHVYLDTFSCNWTTFRVSGPFLCTIDFCVHCGHLLTCVYTTLHMCIWTPFRVTGQLFVYLGPFLCTIDFCVHCGHLLTCVYTTLHSCIWTPFRVTGQLFVYLGPFLCTIDFCVAHCSGECGVNEGVAAAQGGSATVEVERAGLSPANDIGAGRCRAVQHGGRPIIWHGVRKSFGTGLEPIIWHGVRTNHLARG